MSPMKLLVRRLAIAALLVLVAAPLALPLWSARATVQTSANKTIVAGNGVQTAFTFNFVGVAAAYIEVIYTDASGNQTVLAQGSGPTQYQISLNAPVTGAIWGVGGTVTYAPNATPIAAGTTLTILRTLPLTQAISLQNQNSLTRLGNGAETGLDTGVMQGQQISENISRAIVAPVVDATAPGPLPAIAQRANQAMGFDAAGNPIAMAAPSSGMISSAMQPVVDASTLAIGRAAFGLGNAAVENIGSGLQDDGSGNLRVNTTQTTPVATNQSVTSAFNNQSYIATGPITFTLPQANTLWNGFSFTIYAFTASITVTPNANDNFPSLAGGAPYTIPQNAVATFTTNALNPGTWYVAYYPRAVSAPQGYLTPCSATVSVSGCTTGNLLPTSDIIGATTLYYQTGPAGSHIPLYNGAIMMMIPFPELALTLNSNHLSNTIYDVCIFNNGGVPTIVTAPAWQTSTAGSGARGVSAAIVRTSGYWTNSQIITGRNGSNTYTIAANACTMVASIYIDSTAGQLSTYVSYGQSRKWGIFNFYNRQQIIQQEGDPQSSWGYTTSAWRQANAGFNTNNWIDIFSGLPEEPTAAEYTILSQELAIGSGASTLPSIGVGINATNTPTGLTSFFRFQADTANVSNVQAGATLSTRIIVPRSLGVNRIYPLENGNGASANQFDGTAAFMLFTAASKG
jgi:hypothetical protein